MLHKSYCGCKKLLFSLSEDKKIIFRCPRCKKNKVLEIDGSYQYKCDSCGRLFFKIVDNKIEIKCTQCKKMHYKPMSLIDQWQNQQQQVQLD